MASVDAVQFERLYAAIAAIYGDAVADAVTRDLQALRADLDDVYAAVFDSTVHDFARAAERLEVGATPLDLGVLTEMLRNKRD